MRGERTLDQPYRLYNNPLKFVLNIGVFLVVDLAALFVLWRPPFRVNAGTTLMAYVVLCVFGLGLLFYLWLLLNNRVTRRPILEIDTRGWTHYPIFFGSRPQHLNWDDISAIEIRRHQSGLDRMYLLALSPRHPEKLPPAHLQFLAARVAPNLSCAAMLVQLNFVYMRTTPNTIQGLLHDIQARFANELSTNGITVNLKIQQT